MNKKIIAQNQEIVIGTDVSTVKHNVAVTDAVSGDILYNGTLKTSEAEWERLFSRLPGCKTTVVYEAGPDGYALYDLARVKGHAAVVVAPQRHDGPKTDKRDAQHIARDYMAKRARPITVPDFDKRAHRQALRARDELQKTLRQLGSRIGSHQRFNGTASVGLAAVHEDKSGILDFVEAAILDCMNAIKKKIKEIETLLDQMMKWAPYKELATAIKSLPGVGPVTAWHITLDIADLGAFPTAGHFASYLGLCPGSHSSGKTQRHGRITKRGPGRDRGVLTQAAWCVVRCDALEKQRYERLSKRVGKKRAIIAITRRLAERIWWTARGLREAAEQPPAA